MTIVAELKSRTNIIDIWHAIGGGPLQHNRGVAFWRPKANGLNVALDGRRNLWFDHVAGEGGDTISLLMRAHGCDFRAAVEWLADFAGMPLASTRREHSAPRDTNWPSDLRWATWWRIAAVAMAEHILETLTDCAPERRGLTELLNDLSLGPATLVNTYRDWRRRYPRLTHAMLRSGRRADARRQRRLAHWLEKHDAT